MKKLLARCNNILDKLCVQIDNRRVGYSGNVLATEFFAGYARKNGFAVDKQEFDCIDWEGSDVLLRGAGYRSFANAAPYSLPFSGTAPLAHASSIEALRNGDFNGKILLLTGDLTKEQIMPKGFIFYNPDHHREIVSLLEEKAPLAIIAATDTDPGAAGSISPFPLFEDGEFDIPSVYTTVKEGERLRRHTGETTLLDFESRRIPARGCNVIARAGKSLTKRIMVCAHIDAKINSPGALDNATGTAILLLLTDLLKDWDAEAMLEIVAFNGEDYWAVPGQMLYLKENEDKPFQLVINIDAAGASGVPDVYSFYSLPENWQKPLRAALQPPLEEGQPWMQGDHTMFVMKKIPAVAITSANFEDFCKEVTHTPEDNLQKVDAQKVTQTATVLSKAIQTLAGLIE